MQFSKIWYVDASQQKNATKKLFLDFGLFWPFFNQKQPKKKLAKSKPFDDIFRNLVCRCFPTIKMLQIFLVWILTFFGRFLTKQQPKLTKNEENWQNPNRLMKFSEIWYVDASEQKKCYKKLFLDFSLFWPFYNQKTAKK